MFIFGRRPQRPPPPSVVNPDSDDTVLLDQVRTSETRRRVLKYGRRESRVSLVSYTEMYTLFFFLLQPKLARIVLPTNPAFHCSINGRNRWNVYDVYEKPEQQVRARA
jgi:hypothetical protein